MEILKFEEAPKRTSRKRSSSSSRKTILGIAAAAAIAVVGSTLAANISINTANNGNLEFGQGLTQTAACSGSNNITMTPTSSFANSAGAGTFYLSAISFAYSAAMCNGNTFTIKAFADTGNSALAIATSAGSSLSYASFTYSTTANGVTKSSPGTTVGGGAGTSTIAFTNVGTGLATSGAIAKLTIESN